MKQTTIFDEAEQSIKYVLIDITKDGENEDCETVA